MKTSTWAALFVSGVAIVSCSPALAAVKCVDIVSPYSSPEKGPYPTSLRDYERAGSCQVSDKVFSKFSDRVIEKDHIGLTGASWIAVSPVGDGSNEPGLKFSSQFPPTNSSWRVIGNIGAPDEFKMVVRFSVATVSGKALITDALLAIPKSTSASGDGSVVSVVERLTNINESLTVKVTPDASTLTDKITFDPVATLDVVDVVTVLAAKFPGEASLSSWTNQFSEVTGTPEPSTWAMMLIGFAGLGVAGYRRALKNTTALSAA